jgi:hypothetical protein
MRNIPLKELLASMKTYKPEVLRVIARQENIDDMRN